MKCFYHSDMDGKCAGSIVARVTGNYKRNRDMAVYASSDDAFGVLVLFWDGKSKGSKNMKSQAVAFGLEIYENIINRQ